MAGTKTGVTKRRRPAARWGGKRKKASKGKGGEEENPNENVEIKIKSVRVTRK